VPLELQWWGTGVPYQLGLERQKAERDSVQRGERGGLLAFLEHRSVVTLGRRSVERTPSQSWLKKTGTDLVQTRRGGLATWHGPGQLTAYLICDLRPWGIRRTVAALEQGLIAWLAQAGVACDRRAGHPGVWHPSGKLAALGLHVQHGVSMHGFALNLQVEPDVWEAIVPCGIRDASPQSLHRLISSAPAPHQAWPSVGLAIQDALLGLDAGVLAR
jgi:lipoyl(octanoyl) transferase